MPGSTSAKRLHLTEAGSAAAAAYEHTVAKWDPAGLRRSLEDVVITSTSELHASGGWRSKVKAPDTLPHYPVVTGHGGYPDGS